jgi:hypothetical protein
MPSEQTTTQSWTKGKTMLVNTGWIVETENKDGKRDELEKVMKKVVL